ncbi:hypothetical protein [Rhodococcus sp. RD6.2]|uniref:hypothetical protein n=1 Tax=Rhodococcus sp. RD6.2 TaxID=260936 RepID=UPI0034603D68
MHEADQHGAFEERAAAVAPDGTLLIQFHSLHTIVRQEQWNALRHKHFAYYSLTALIRLLAQVGMHVVAAWEFPLYGGTVLVVATRSPVEGTSSTVRRILRTESAFRIDSMTVVAQLQESADRQARSLRAWLESAADAGVRVHAYGASSRAVALLHHADIDRRLIAAVADASEAKQGRRMPGTDIPVVSPAELVAAQPDRVLLTLPDLFPEVRQALPDLEGRWVLDWADDSHPRHPPDNHPHHPHGQSPAPPTRVQQPGSSAART